MKRFHKITYILLAFFILSLTTNCKKEDEPSVSELLSSHSWKFNGMTTDSEEDEILGIIALGNIAMINSVLTFYDNGLYEMKRGDMVISDGGWGIANKNILLMDGEQARIKKLTDAELIWENEAEHAQYGKYTISIHWKKVTQ